MRYLAFLFTLISSLSFSSQNDRALDIYNSVSGSFNSTTAISDNFHNPLTSDAPMKTLDGQKTFDAQMSCNAQTKYLQVSATPNATNEINIQWRLDSDLDGHWNEIGNIMGVSAVCQNGYVVCDKGTMNNCDYYNLEATNYVQHKKLYTEEEQGKLFDCNCHNNSCGQNLGELNKDKISRTIATQISLSMANYDPKFIASKVETVNGITSYYGNDLTSCDSVVGSDEALNSLVSAGKAKDIEALEQAGRSEETNQQDSGPFYLATQQQNHGFSGGQAVHDCSVTRNYAIEETTIDQITQLTGWTKKGVNPESCHYNLISGIVSCTTQEVDNNNYNSTSPLYFTPLEYSEVCPDGELSDTEITLHSDRWDQYTFAAYTEMEDQVRASLSNPPELSNAHYWTPSCANGLTGRFRFTNDSWILSSNNTYFSRLIFVIKNKSCDLVETIQDTCSDVPVNDCELSDERVDSVETIRKTVPTNNYPSPSTITVGNDQCSREVTRPWFTTTRRYLCSDNQSPNFDLSHLQDPTINGDQVTVNGLDSGSINLEVPTFEVPNCQKSCEVKKEIIDDQSNASGQTSDARISTTRTEKIYKSCEQDLCPLEAGETISKPCSCSSNFGAAATSLQMLRLAGQDMRCESE